MATGRKTVVVGQVLDPDVWGNPLWDQSVQTFTSAADRTAQFAAPKQGAVTWLEDVKRLEVFNGTAWVPVLEDAPWTQITVFAANWAPLISSGWDGLWWSVRGGVATVTGAVTKTTGGAPVAGDVVCTLPAAIRPLHPVLGYTNATTGSPRVEITGNLALTGGAPASFSLGVTYALGRAA